MNHLKKTLLIIEANKENQKIFFEIFQQRFELIFSPTGADALAVLANNADFIRLILLRDILPDINALELLHILCDTPSFSFIPVVLLTENSNPTNENDAIAKGAIDVFSAPFHTELLNQRVRTILENQELRHVRQENTSLRKESQAQIRLQAIMENLDGGIVLLEIQPDQIKTIFLNEGFYRMKYHSITHRQKYSDNIFENVHPEDKRMLFAEGKRAVEENRAFTFEYRVLYENTICWFHLRASEIKYPESQYPVILAIITDISELKNAEETLEETNVQLSAIMENVPGGIAIIEIKNQMDLYIRFCNRGFFSLSGFPCPADLENRPLTLSDYIVTEDLMILQDEVFRSIRSNRILNTTVRLKRLQGGYLWIQITASRIFDSNSANPLFCTMLSDVTITKEHEKMLRIANERLNHVIYYDNLTGLHNRIGFCKKTASMLQNTEGQTYVLLLLNIERFKIINDLFGSQAGDAVLKEIADELTIITKGIGSCGRLDGDHFVFCIPKLDLHQAALLYRLERRLQSMSIDYKLSLNFGVYEIEDISIPIDQMCDRANLALQTIKGNYVERFAYYDDALRQSIIAEQKIISEMKNALENHEFVIFLQPVYSLTTLQIISAEVLIRWLSPEHGIVSPGLFIPLFERNGFISMLDAYVWEETCKYLKLRHDMGKPDLSVSVNVSRRSLYNPNLCEQIVALTEKYGIEPHLLKLEITESAYMDNQKQLLDTITKLQNKGFIILMDDFGSGYSSLNTLKDISVDILKIDMKFMEKFETSNRAGNILTSVIRMAKWLNIPVIAEGVETRPQIDFLKSIGCDRIQGYFFSKPLAIPDFEKLMTQVGNIMEESEAHSFSAEDLDALFNGSPIFNHFLNGMIGAVGIYEFHDTHLEVLRANDAYYTLFNYDLQTHQNENINAFDAVHELDREKLLEACKQVATQHGEAELKLRHIGKQDTLLWVKVKITYLCGTQEQPILSIVMIPQ